MKQIIFPIVNKANTISAEEIKKNTDPLIGWICHSGSKGFFAKSEYKGSTYVAHALEGFEKGNRWTQGIEDKTLDQWFTYFNIEAMQQQHRPSTIQWFSFDTPQEMFAWLAE